MTIATPACRTGQAAAELRRPEETTARRNSTLAATAPPLGKRPWRRAETACGGGLNSVWFPDLRKDESFIDLSIMVKF